MKKFHAMADGMLLTEAQIVKQLRDALKSTTKTWNYTSIKSIIRIMDVLDVTPKTKQLAEDCLVKFLLENIPASRIPKGNIKGLIHRVPRGLLASLLDTIDEPLNKVATRLARENPELPMTPASAQKAFDMGCELAKKAFERTLPTKQCAKYVPKRGATKKRKRRRL